MAIKSKRHSYIFNFKIARAGLFSLLSVVLLLLTGNLLEERDDIKKRWDSFYGLPKNSLDILVLGNSHAYSTYDPDILDVICGTNSFVLASNSQKIEQTFYNLKESLRYQNPKVVVIQASVLTGDSWKTMPGDNRVYSNLDGMHLSFSKVGAIIHQRPINEFISGVFSIFRNHYEWKNGDMISNNLSHFETSSAEDFRGFSPRASIMTQKVAKQYEEAEKEDFHEFEVSQSDKDYLSRIKELSERHDFEVVYVMSPKYSDIINVHYSKKHEIIRREILKQGSVFIDYNILGKQIELSERSFENGFIGYQHTSHYGANQVSFHLASYLKERFSADFNEKGSQNTALWQVRMENAIEPYIIRPDFPFKSARLKKLGSNLILFEDISIKELYLLHTMSGEHVLLFEFPKELNLEKLENYKFYIHLYPDKGDVNIKTDRQEFGYENFDFIPKVLPNPQEGFYTFQRLDTNVKSAETLNIGLFKTGLKKSEQISIKNIDLERD